MEQGQKFGDTLCACVDCGAVYVAGAVATEMSRDAAVSLGANRSFRGRTCLGCRKNAHWSMYRILAGPLRVPRMDADGAAPVAPAKPIWACRVCDFVSKDQAEIARHRTEFGHPIRPAGEAAEEHASTSTPGPKAAAPGKPAAAPAPVPAPVQAPSDGDVPVTSDGG